MTKRVFIDDLPEMHKQILKTALRLSVAELPIPGASAEEKLAPAIELFELGYLKIEDARGHVKIKPCFPNDAPQLQSLFAKEEH
jgi:hypothetical protein